MVIDTKEKEWLTVTEFCQRYGLGKNLVYDSVRERRLRSIKLGGKVLIAADALNELADKRIADTDDNGTAL